MVAGKLSPTETLRAKILLDDAIKKLKFLMKLSETGISKDRNFDLTQFVGDEISHIIQLQRSLEKDYENLITQRDDFKDLLHKAEFQEVQDKIQEVSNRLRESNIALNRNLKENPNIQENLAKMNNERAMVQDIFLEMRAELEEWSYQTLVQKVENERRSQEMLGEVRKKEKEVSSQVRELEAELAFEKEEWSRETSSALAETKELKAELRQKRQEASISLAIEEKKLKSQLAALQRSVEVKELDYVKELERLQQQLALETSVHEQAKTFLTKRVETLARDRQDWAERSDAEFQQYNQNLVRLREDRNALLAQLRDLEQREEEAQKEAARTKKQQDLHTQIEAIQEQLAEKKLVVIGTLQEEGRLYMDRLRIVLANTKGKKKGGKKGKK